MAEYVMPPEMEDFMEVAGDVAMDNFARAFEADPLHHSLTQWVL